VQREEGEGLFPCRERVSAERGKVQREGKCRERESAERG
jgi:hypothetical protein